MSQAPSIAFAGSSEDSHPEATANVSLRGTARGLEISIAGTPSAAALGARLSELLAEAPSFFAGSNARVAIDGMLPVGALACLEEVAAKFELRIVELGPTASRRPRAELTAMPAHALPPIPPIPQPPPAQPVAVASTAADAPRAELAEGTGPIAEDATEAGEAKNAASARSSAPDEAAAKAASPGAPPSAPIDLAWFEPGALSESLAALGPIAPARKLNTSPEPGAPGDAAAGPGPGLLAALAAVLVAAGDQAAVEATKAAAAEAVAAAEALAGAALAAAAEATADAVAAAAQAAAEPPGPRFVIGPVRSGRIVDHVGHLIILGDVNPGAEVRAEGSIIVLGRLRGVAHAAIGRDAGCIIALSLQPQQLRIGRMVARAGDADRPGGGAEIAYATGETIVVERFLGRLPSGLAASM